MKKKGFTLIELLVVIAIIAMLLAILMPALNKVKRLAQRLVCATNLKGLGTAMMVYSNDDKYDQYPNANRGGLHIWAENTQGWEQPQFNWSGNTDTNLSTAASWYLLVRDADVDPKSFVCKSSDQRAYEGQNPNAEDMVELWDFGSTTYGISIGESLGPRNCVSYAYQNPFKMSTSIPARPANSTAPASFALGADRNPYFDDAGTRGTATVDSYMGIADELVDDWTTAITPQKWEIQKANSFAHNREGQNILYNDGHAEFAKRPDVGVQNDNIYVNCDGGASPPWTETNIRQGNPLAMTLSLGAARSANDSYLVNDVEP